MIPEPTGHPGVDAFLVWASVGTLALTLGGALWRFGRAVARIAQRVNAFFDDWNGEPARPGVPPRPGVMERVQGIEQWMRTVRHELQPNSGESLRDQVDLVNCLLRRMVPDEDHCRHRPDDPPPPPAGT